MPPVSKTASSTPRLSEYAYRFTFPKDRIERTVWTRVEAKGRELGLGFDWWQSQLGTVCLGYGSDGKYVATIGGVGLSIPRQVGKTYFVMAMLVIMCILFPGLQVVWTSHHLRTTTKTLTTVKGIARRRKVAPHVRTVRTSHGEGQVEFVNGSTIMFGARSQGFGRGFDEIDVEVFDEAQILDTKALEDMIAATNQARHVHGALLFFMGTPPTPLNPSEAFRLRRAEAWGDEAEDAIWLEISADPESDPDDESQWTAMNPSYPLRTPRESMLRLKRNLKDKNSWNREGRGVWDTGDKLTAFPFSRWTRLATLTPPTDGTRVLGVKFSIDGARVAVSAAVRDPAGDLVHVECIGVAPLSEGTAWLVDKITASWRSYAAVVIDGKSGAGDFVNALRARKVPSHRIVTPSTDQVITAHSGFLRAVLDGSLSHLGQPGLDTQVRSAGRRKIGQAGGWGIEPTAAGGDVVALESAIFAQWGAMTAKRRTGTRDGSTGRTSNGRRGAVVL